MCTDEKNDKHANHDLPNDDFLCYSQVVECFKIHRIFRDQKHATNDALANTFFWRFLEIVINNGLLVRVRLEQIS